MPDVDRTGRTSHFLRNSYDRDRQMLAPYDCHNGGANDDYRDRRPNRKRDRHRRQADGRITAAVSPEFYGRHIRATPEKISLSWSGPLQLDGQRPLLPVGTGYRHDGLAHQSRPAGSGCSLHVYLMPGIPCRTNSPETLSHENHSPLKPARIHRDRWGVLNIPVKVRVPRRKLLRVLADEPPDRRIIIPRMIVVNPGRQSRTPSPQT